MSLFRNSEKLFFYAKSEIIAKIFVLNCRSIKKVVKKIRNRLKNSSDSRQSRQNKIFRQLLTKMIETEGYLGKNSDFYRFEMISNFR